MKEKIQHYLSIKKNMTNKTNGFPFPLSPSPFLSLHACF